ncbi:uncharacterized protein CBL_06593 [Carabus blaptoides fortunei]
MSENISPNDVQIENNLIKSKYDDKFKLKAGIFLTCVTGISAMIGFGTTIMAAKKQDPKYFGKGIVGTIEMTETGASLALRALGWGSLYAVTGCSVLFYTIWKVSGAKDLKEFRHKVGLVLPRVPKNDPPQGRTEFSGMNDLLSYLANQKSKKD